MRMACCRLYASPHNRCRLFVCRIDCLLADGSVGAVGDDPVAVADALVPQAGVLAYLPLTNNAFQTNSIDVSFSEAGALTHLKYDTNANALAATETFAKTVDAFAKYQAAKQNAGTDKIKQDTERAKAETERLKAEKELIEARKALTDAGQ